MGDAPTPDCTRWSSDRRDRRSPRSRSWRRPKSGERLAACMSVGPIDARDRFSRNDVLDPVPPGEDNEGRVCAQCGQGHQPPDVPDQRESHEGGEEGANESGRAIPRHLDLRIGGLLAELRLLASAALLHVPVGVRALDAWEYRKVEGWRRRGCCPFEGASVPGIAGLVAKRLAPTNTDGELYDLQDYSGQDDGRPA